MASFFFDISKVWDTDNQITLSSSKHHNVGLMLAVDDVFSYFAEQESADMK